MVSENARRLREEKRLTLDEAARLTGVSRSMLAQIEKGDVNPTISMVWKIANGYKVSFTSLVEPARERPVLLRGDDAPILEEDGGRYRNCPAFPFDGERGFETYRIVMLPGGALEAQPHLPGTEEYVTVFAGEAEIGVIRFRVEYRDYFEEQTAQQELSLQILSRYRYHLILPHSHPLAERSVIHTADLELYPEITHGDNLRTHSRQTDIACRKVYTVDRMAQLALLQTLPNAYMGGPEMPDRYLWQFGLVQKTCVDNPIIYHNALVLHPRYAMTEIESGYVQHIMQKCK